MTKWVPLTMLAAAFVGLSQGCIIHNYDSVRGSGRIVTEERTIGRFERLEIQGAADVIVDIGDDWTLVVETDDNILPKITTTVRGDRLIIGSKGSYSTRHGVKVHVTTTALAGVRVAGSGDVVINGARGARLDASILGSGNVTVVGDVGEFDASVAGSGDIDGSRLIARSVSAAIAGSGDIDVHATESLEGSIAGSGDITYRGNPLNVNVSKAGSGRVTQL